MAQFEASQQGDIYVALLAVAASLPVMEHYLPPAKVQQFGGSFGFVLSVRCRVAADAVGLFLHSRIFEPPLPKKNAAPVGAASA
jgi:hypothetical protein